MTRTIVYLSALSCVLAGSAMAAMTLTSRDIQPGATISAAQIYPRCGGENISPELSWSGAPLGTKSFVLTMIDVSVKPSQWSHWIVVGLPPDATSLARGTKALPAGAAAIASNFGDANYDGPCPPNGTGVHEYQLTIWALATPTLSLVADMKATDLNRALAKAALDHASLTGFVKR
jgi:Raf kinase inhibitor-like YbhB/YbcL family protein